MAFLEACPFKAIIFLNLSGLWLTLCECEECKSLMNFFWFSIFVVEQISNDLIGSEWILQLRIKWFKFESIILTKSYFETVTYTEKISSNLKTSVDQFFTQGGWKSSTNFMKDLAELTFSIFDLTECIQQTMWLVVTSEPDNKFGKKSFLDALPFKK